MNVKSIISNGVIVAGVILLFFSIKTCNSLNEVNSLYEGVSSELITFKNERGLMESHILGLEAENKKSLLKIKSKDSTILWLQNVVRKYKGKINTAVVAGVETESIGSTETTIVKSDTVIKDSIVYVYPVYESQWDNKWESGIIEASKDSVKRDIKVRNDFEITLGKVSNGWFKKKEYRVNMLNLNPNTVTRELRSFNVKSKPKRWALGFSGGYGFYNGGLGFYLGAGVNYNVIYIK